MLRYLLPLLLLAPVAATAADEVTKIRCYPLDGKSPRHLAYQDYTIDHADQSVTLVEFLYGPKPPEEFEIYAVDDDAIFASKPEQKGIYLRLDRYNVTAQYFNTNVPGSLPVTTCVVAEPRF